MMLAPRPKVKPWRSEKYRRFVASQPCFSCALFGHSQAAHANTGKGMRTKTDDSTCFPLCAALPGRMGCHEQHDLLVDMTLDERREREVVYVERMRDLARKNGWPV